MSSKFYYFPSEIKAKIDERLIMHFIIRALFSITVYGIVGYILSMLLVIFNKYIGFNIIRQSQSSEQLSFFDMLTYIFSNLLTYEDFLFCFYGLVFMFFVGVLRNFEKITSTY